MKARESWGEAAIMETTRFARGARGTRWNADVANRLRDCLEYLQMIQEAADGIELGLATEGREYRRAA